MNLSGWLAYTTALNAQPEDWRYRETVLHGLLAADDLIIERAKNAKNCHIDNIRLTHCQVFYLNECLSDRLTDINPSIPTQTRIPTTAYKKF